MNQIKTGKFIAQLRKEKNMTQSNLGDRLGVSFKTVSKWENGRGMPELSLLKPLSDELGITINELLSGERIKKEQYIDKLEENIVNTIEYSNKKINNSNNILGIVLIAFGILITLTAMTIFPPDSSWGSVYSIFGAIVSLIGVSRFTRRIKYAKRVMINFGFFIIMVAFLFTIDFVSVKLNEQIPRFCTKKLTIYDSMLCETPFYNAYIINKDTENEKFVVAKHISISTENAKEIIENYK
jgi:transcriptional regulator with XRE-family HTH domain